VADRIGVSVADLAAALEDFNVEVTSPFRERTGTTNAGGIIANPGEVADALYRTLSVNAGEIHPLDRAGGEADEELAAIATAVGHFECLDELAVRRVLRYLADRYGIED
jgi:hypothetical protein